MLGRVNIHCVRPLGRMHTILVVFVFERLVDNLLVGYLINMFKLKNPGGNRC